MLVHGVSAEELLGVQMTQNETAIKNQASSTIVVVLQ